MSRFPLGRNVGRLDAGIRFVLGAGLVAGAFVLAGTLGPHWLLTALLHPSILGAYLVLSGAARSCFFYHALGLDTFHQRERATDATRLGPPRAPGRQRPSS